MISAAGLDFSTREDPRITVLASEISSAFGFPSTGEDSSEDSAALSFPSVSPPDRSSRAELEGTARWTVDASIRIGSSDGMMISGL